MSEDELGRICAQLTRIADTLALLIPDQDPTALDPEPLGCPHPEHLRVDLGTTPEGWSEWECRMCRSRFRSALPLDPETAIPASPPEA